MKCPECDYGTAYYDGHLEEVFCARCGLMLMWNPPYTHGKPALGGAPFNHSALHGSVIAKEREERRINTQSESYRSVVHLQNTVERWHGDSSLWRRKQYHRYIGVVNSNLNMTPYEKDRAHFIIDKVPDFRKLHYKNDYCFLVSAICIYSMENKDIDYNNSFLKGMDLSREQFDRVKLKLDDLIKETEQEYI